MPAPITATAITFIVLCCAVDVRSRRIPNVLSGGAMTAGLGLNAWYFGAPGLLASLAGLGLTIAVLLPAFALRGIGGGDVKMMGALGAMLGPRLALGGLVAGMILGGVIMAVHLLRRGRLWEKLEATRSMVMAAAVSRSTAPLAAPAADPAAIALPYSVPLGLGTAGVLAFTVLP